MIKLKSQIAIHPVKVTHLNDFVCLVIALVRQGLPIKYKPSTCFTKGIFIFELLVIIGTSRKEERNGSYRRYAPPGRQHIENAPPG
jgi:hypothetical protein